MTLSTDRETFEIHVGGLLGWEKRKRCERALVTAFAAGLLAALAVPLVATVPRDWGWIVPIVFFILIAPVVLFMQRWRESDTVKALAAVDRALGLDERVTTAWELIRRNDDRAAARLVLRQAAERIKGSDARELFPRRWNKRGLLVVPLLALWLMLQLFDAHFWRDAAMPRESPSLARELSEFARRLQETARSEGLPKALDTGRELERIARRSIATNGSDDALRQEMAAVQERIGSDTQAMAQAPFGTSQSQWQLRDLKAELESAREWLQMPEFDARSWAGRLDALTQLRKHGDWSSAPDGQALNREQLGAFLDKLDKRVTAELDRRAMLETERYLRQLAQGGEESKRAGRAGEGGKDAPGGQPSGERGHAGDPMSAGRGSAPGLKPGGAPAGESPLPDYRVGERSQPVGDGGKGERSVIFFRGEPAAGKSTVSEDEVIAAYRRQAEAELHAERIPGALKETVRNYFLSLDEAK